MRVLCLLVLVAVVNCANVVRDCTSRPCGDGICYDRPNGRRVDGKMRTDLRFHCICNGDLGGPTCNVERPCNDLCPAIKDVMCMRNTITSRGRTCYTNKGVELVESTKSTNKRTLALSDEVKQKLLNAIVQRPDESDVEFKDRLAKHIQMVALILQRLRNQDKTSVEGTPDESSEEETPDVSSEEETPAKIDGIGKPSVDPIIAAMRDLIGGSVVR